MVATAVAVGLQHTIGTHTVLLVHILSWYIVASRMAAVVVKVVTVLLSGCNSSCNRLQYIYMHSAAILVWYTVARCMVAVVVRVATVLLSGCNSSCTRLQHTQCYNILSW